MSWELIRIPIAVIPTGKNSESIPLTDIYTKVDGSAIRNRRGYLRERMRPAEFPLGLKNIRKPIRITCIPAPVIIRPI